MRARPAYDPLPFDLRARLAATPATPPVAPKPSPRATQDRRARDHRYNTSEKGRQRNRRYERGPAAWERRRRYDTTPKGIARKLRYEIEVRPGSRVSDPNIGYMLETWGRRRWTNHLSSHERRVLTTVLRSQREKALIP